MATGNVINANSAGTVHYNGSGTFTGISDGTDGQLLIGSSAGVPAFATATGTNGIAFTPGHNSLVITNSAIPNSALANSSITVSAGTGISISGSPVSLGGTVTINATGAGFTWTDATNASYTVAAQNGYVADRGTLVTFTLPTNNALGDTIQIVGKGAGGWTIVYAAGQQIFFGSSTTTATTGALASTNAHDCVTLVCTTASASAPIFTVSNAVGNLTIT